eukprot:Hpha_TRINITY_DN33560_c0_g1::TRINITY_DN33560_c0_g1_i1::g.170995::m.170995
MGARSSSAKKNAARQPGPTPRDSTATGMNRQSTAHGSTAPDWRSTAPRPQSGAPPRNEQHGHTQPSSPPSPNEPVAPLPNMPMFNPAHDSDAMDAVRQGILEAESDKIDCFTFPADEWFWSAFVQQAKLNDEAAKRPRCDVTASHDPGNQVNVNRKWMSGYVRGWEKANPHTVEVKTPEGAVQFYASDEFWGKVVNNLPQTDKTDPDALTLETAGKPTITTTKEAWRDACEDWEREKKCTSEDLKRQERALEREAAVVVERRASEERKQRESVAAAAAPAPAAVPTVRTKRTLSLVTVSAPPHKHRSSVSALPTAPPSPPAKVAEERKAADPLPSAGRCVLCGRPCPAAGFDATPCPASGWGEGWWPQVSCVLRVPHTVDALSHRLGPVDNRVGLPPPELQVTSLRPLRDASTAQPASTARSPPPAPPPDEDSEVYVSVRSPVGSYRNAFFQPPPSSSGLTAFPFPHPPSSLGPQSYGPCWSSRGEMWRPAPLRPLGCTHRMQPSHPVLL